MRALAPASAAALVPPHCAAVSDSPTIPDDRRLDVAELFVTADSIDRSSLDVLCLALVGRNGALEDRPGEVRLVVLGPQEIRSHSRPGVAGLTAVDLPLVPVPGVRWVSVAIVRMRRQPRLSRIAATIVELAQVLDYSADPVGSDAAALAALDRLEILTTTGRVDVPVAGHVLLDTVPEDDDGYAVLAAKAASSSVETGVVLRPGRAPKLSAAGRGEDHLVLRFGPPRRRRGAERSLVDLRRERALSELGLDSEQDGTNGQDSEEVARNVARARQDTRARTIVLGVAAGETAAAIAACRDALAISEELDGFRESLSGRIAAPAEFWRVVDVVEAAGNGPDALTEGARDLRDGLDTRLEELLGMDLAGTDKELLIPVVTPIVLEIADDLVPYVDSRQDGGRFLNQLIPWMRDRITADTGVRPPGVRARGNPNLFLGQYRIQIDEVPVVTAQMDSRGAYRADPAHSLDGYESEVRDHTYIHPVNGEIGRWAIRDVPGTASVPIDGVPGDETKASVGGSAFGVPHYLISQIELVVRSRLNRFLGPVEVNLLVDEWAAENETAARLDTRMRRRLTWVLQAMVADRVPILDSSVILDTVGDLRKPVAELCRATRAALRKQLPGRTPADQWVHVPSWLESSVLSSSGGGDGAAENQLQIELAGWLRDAAKSNGSVFVVVTGSQQLREIIVPIVRSHLPLVVTLAEEELP
ncbi:FHIPEP family type III secretion protein [Pseudonocardia charpentierae]|uniref:FHIPEP family type III secretion protein n=1 Tax=Pseudonocardia charpentierae TaxID=3075545 RepID=A0ABU2NI22_9PSEU|nr:FHIPEP family type III secretion protein [Pseudonocardia sp. DSM 45834]MDT0353613.1 FHIPEP family type III secretion protein [Pseudonocardia sp. DSM 45834]